MAREYLPYYVHKFKLDGQEVTVRIKRMDYGEFQEFSFRSEELEKTVLEQRIFRKHDGPEQEKDEKGDYVISWEELCRRRLSEMPPEERTEIEALQDVRRREQDDFLRECVEKYVIHVEPGLIDVHKDGSKHPVTDGKGLVAITGGRRTLHLLLYQAIFSENHLDEDQKKALQSLAGSSDSSSKQSQDRVGRKRGRTAGSVGTSASAGNGVASSQRKGRSGSAGRKKSRSSSKPAPSSH